MQTLLPDIVLQTSRNQFTTMIISFDFTEICVSYVIKFTARHAAENNFCISNKNTLKLTGKNTVADIYNYEFNNMGMVLKYIEQLSCSIILRLVLVG